MKKLKKNYFMLDEDKTGISFCFLQDCLLVKRFDNGDTIAQIILYYPEDKTDYDIVEGMIEKFEKNKAYNFKNGSVGYYIRQQSSLGYAEIAMVNSMVEILLPNLKELIDYDDNPMPEIHTDNYFVAPSPGLADRFIWFFDNEENRRLHSKNCTCIFSVQSGEPVVIWRRK